MKKDLMKEGFIKYASGLLYKLCGQEVSLFINEHFYVNGILSEYDDNFVINIPEKDNVAVFEKKSIMKVDSLNKEIYVNEALIL